MKTKLIFVFLLLVAFAHGQTEITLPGDAYKFKFLKVESAIALPGGNTATRPSPLTGRYWIRYNTDSLKFEYSTGSLWNSFNGGSVSVPTSWGAITGSLTTQEDLATALNIRLNKTDTSSMLAPYLKVSTAAATYLTQSGSYSNPPWITSIAWNKITATPSTFPPSSHGHSLAELSQSSASANQIVQWDGAAWVPITATKALVGLSLADNTPDVTKPVSAAQATRIADSSANKVRLFYKKPGTDSVFARYNNGDVFMIRDSANAVGFTPPGDNTKILVGDGTGQSASTIKLLLSLNLLDNTSDINKPVSTAQATAISSKINVSDSANMLDPYLRKNAAAAIYSPIIPVEWSYLVPDTSIVRDTLLSLTCGSMSLSYIHLSIPQFIGFKVRALVQGYDMPSGLTTEGITQYCTFATAFFIWYSGTGDLYIMCSRPKMNLAAQYFKVVAY